MPLVIDQKLFPIAAIIVSLVALWITTRNYRRKSGVSIRGAFSLASSRNCDDLYVSQVTLENQKDRAITIFGIYLRVGYSYYVELDNFEETPYVLRPFEVYQRAYGPIEFYAVNSHKLDLNDLLKDRKVRSRLVLSTGDGKYTVKSFIPRWHPVGEFFRNHRAAVVRPITSKYKEIYLGANIKYVVEMSTVGSAENITPIHPDDYQLKIFRGFPLTRESLSTRDALEKFLLEQQRLGTLSAATVTVHDVDTWRKLAHEFYDGPRLRAPHYNGVQFFVGLLTTAYDSWNTRRLNRKL
jgi:hypothetical protein